MEFTPEQQAEFAKLYEQSIKEALAGLDRIGAEAKEMQVTAVEEIIRTKEERKKIEASAEEIANEVLSRREKEMRSEIRRKIDVDYITRLLMFGRTRTEICEWLDLDEDTVQRVWTSLVGHNTNTDGMIRISQFGPSGMITYRLQEKVLNFHWEFGGGDVLALINVPNEKTWELQTGLALSKRQELLTFMAEQVIRQRASGCSFQILDDVIEIRPE